MLLCAHKTKLLYNLTMPVVGQNKYTLLREARNICIHTFLKNKWPIIIPGNITEENQLHSTSPSVLKHFIWSRQSNDIQGCVPIIHMSWVPDLESSHHWAYCRLAACLILQSSDLWYICFLPDSSSSAPLSQRRHPVSKEFFYPTEKWDFMSNVKYCNLFCMRWGKKYLKLAADRS